MPPKTARQQTNKQPAAEMRKHSSKPQTKAPMTTEYQERSLPPCYYVGIMSMATKRSPYHPLKGTSDGITSLRSFYFEHNWIKRPPTAPQTPDYRGWEKGAPLNAANQMPSSADYTSLSENEFKKWEDSKRQPFVLKDNLTVKHGLGNRFALAKEREPITATTSYKSDYIHHPTNPRPVKLKHSNQSSNDLPLEPRLPFKPKQAWYAHQDDLDEAGDRFKKFNSSSLETKFQGHTKDFTSPANHNVHCQVKNLPALKINDVPRRAATAMTNDYRAWHSPQSFTVGTPFSVGKPKSPDDSKASPKTSRQRPKTQKSAACNSSRGATQKPQSPADTDVFSGFEYSTEHGESEMYWYGNLDRGGTWPDGDDCVDQSSQIISRMVSTRN